MAIGAIVNALMGPGAGFPEPLMPPLNLPRNSLTSIGVYLHNYQFQLTRLVPFISRLADLLQREALVATPRERIQMQVMAHHVGQALHEIVYATAPIAHLVRDIQIGEEPGSFRMINRPNIDLAPFAASHVLPEAAGAVQRPPGVTIVVAEPPPQMRPVEHHLHEAQEKELVDTLGTVKSKLTEISALPRQDSEPTLMQKARTLADFVKARIDQILAQKAWHARMREVLPDMLPCEKTQEKILLEILYGVPLHEGYELLKGNFEALVVAIPPILRILVTLMSGRFDPEARKTMCRNMIEELKGAVIVPNEIKSNMLPGFDPVCAIERMLEPIFNEILQELVEFDRHRDRTRLAEKIRFLLIKMIGESIAELSEGFNNEVADVEVLIKHNIGVLLRKFNSDGLGIVLDNLLSKYLYDVMINKAYSLYKSEESKRKEEARSKKQEEEKKPASPQKSPTVLPKAPEEIKKAFAPPTAAPEEAKKVAQPSVVSDEVKKTPVASTNEEIKRIQLQAVPQEKALPEVVVPEKWKKTLEADMKAQEETKSQKPFSHAYIATDPNRGPQSIQRVNESPLKKELRDAMQAMNLDKDDITETVGDVGEDLEAIYAEYVRQEFEKRIKDDIDYDIEKHKWLKRFVTNQK